MNAENYSIQILQLAYVKELGAVRTSGGRQLQNINNMYLKNLLSEASNVSITVTLQDLKEFHDWAVNEARLEGEQAIKSGNIEPLFSPEKVCEMLEVNRSTLWRWSKRGYLVPIEIGGKRRYRGSDLMKLQERKG